MFTSPILQDLVFKMSHSISLPSLSPREAVTDALYRCVIGMDDNNKEMLESAFVQDEETSFVLGDNKIEGADAINDYIFTNILPLHTTHHITNVRVDVKDGADTAYMTCHAMAQHFHAKDAFKPGAQSFLTGGLYYVDLVKDNVDGLWKVKTWKIKFNWFTGDSSIVMKD